MSRAFPLPISLAAAIGLSFVLLSGPTPAAPESDDLILAGAPERIEKHRTGALTVRVVDQEGNAVAGAGVTVRQKRHEFLFGCNIFRWGRVGTPEEEKAYRDRFSALLNFATLPFYWRGYEPVRGEPAHESREAIARWCREHGITTKGHPLVWNHPAGVPSWLPEDAGEIRKLSDARVRECVRRFEGLIGIWDVVNEATDPLRFREGNLMTAAYEKVGTLEWTLGSFRVARKANPEATLIINDYRTDKEYAKLISALVDDRSRPLYDTIGIQSHMHGGAWPPRRTWEVCETFARFGVPLHFTETTIVSGPRTEGRRRWGPTEPELEKSQARDAVRFYTTLFSHPAVEAITWWDFADRGAWQGAAAGFLRNDLSPKPVYHRLMELIKDRWWTEEAADTNASGEATVRAFFGDYEVEVRKGERKGKATAAHTRKQGSTTVEVVLEK